MPAGRKRKRSEKGVTEEESGQLLDQMEVIKDAKRGRSVETSMYSVSSSRSKVCVVCCISYVTIHGESAAATDPFSRHADFINFCDIVETYSNSTNADSSKNRTSLMNTLKSREKLSVCKECLSIISTVMDRNKEVQQLENHVRELQTQIVQQLQQLDGKMGEFLGDLGKVKGIIKRADKSCLKHFLDDSSGLQHVKTIQLFRDKILEVEKDLQFFRQKVNYGPKKSSKKKKATSQKRINRVHSSTPNKVPTVPSVIEASVNQDMSHVEIENDHTHTNQEQVESFSLDPAAFTTSIVEFVDNESTQGQTTFLFETGSSIKPSLHSDATPATVPIEFISSPLKKSKLSDGAITLERVDHGVVIINSRSENIMEAGCNVCGKPFKETMKSFARERHKWSHLNAEERMEAVLNGAKDPAHEQQEKVQCSVCGLLVQKRRLSKHEKTHFSTQKVLVCSYCPKTFSSEENLSGHVKRVHGNSQEEKERKLQCPICPKKWKTQQHLKIHLGSHSDEKPFLCDLGCGTRLKTKRNLKRHQKICDGTRNFTMKNSRHQNQTVSVIEAEHQPIETLIVPEVPVTIGVASDGSVSTPVPVQIPMTLAMPNDHVYSVQQVTLLLNPDNSHSFFLN